MKKVWPAVLCLLFLCSCGKEIDRAEAMQEQYKNLASYETDVRVSVPRGDETLVYALHLSAQGDAVRATVSEPEELTGVGAMLEGDKLTLTACRSCCKTSRKCISTARARRRSETSMRCVPIFH